MRRYLVSPEGTYYKANLHSHSTLSDGELSPEQMKAAYKERGYQILAITDHEYIADHSDLTEEDFLMINGMELYVKSDPVMGRFYATCHLNLLAKEPHNVKHIQVDPKYILYANKDCIDELDKDGEIVYRLYSVRWINRIIEQANKNGYLVVYNHPAWSMEEPADYMRYEGLFGMEIYNHGTSHVEGFPGSDGKIYDLLLRQGRKLFCLANDDNHDKYPIGHPLNDSFGGFNMIRAESLTYEAVMRALEAGDFYASTGPEFAEVYADDEERLVVKMKTPVRHMYLSCMGRPGVKGRVCHLVKPDMELFTEGEFKLVPGEGYVRVHVVDEFGREAFTQPIFFE